MELLKKINEFADALARLNGQALMVKSTVQELYKLLEPIEEKENDCECE